MNWTWVIDEGALLTPAGLLMAYGYSGAHPHVNDPSAIQIPNVGPIPVGFFRKGKAYDDPETGPDTIPLTPLPGTEMYGRFGFKMHGDSIAHAGLQMASKGCIVDAVFARRRFDESPIDILEVVATRSAPQQPVA